MGWRLWLLAMSKPVSQCTRNRDVQMLRAMLISALCLIASGRGAIAEAASAASVVNPVLESSTTFKLPGNEPILIQSAVAFQGAFAVSAVKDDAQSPYNFREGVVFDLQNHAWHHPGKNAWVSLNDCREWERLSKKKSKLTMWLAPKEEREFLQTMLDPAFEVTELRTGELQISDGGLQYTVTPGKDVSAEVLQNFYRYDQLNAYHKAMTDKQLPPTAQIALDAILSKRGVFPAKLNAKIRSAAGDVLITVTTLIRAPSDDESGYIRAAIQPHLNKILPSQSAK
jgi:hypothetical protein